MVKITYGNSLLHFLRITAFSFPGSGKNHKTQKRKDKSLDHANFILPIKWKLEKDKFPRKFMHLIKIFSKIVKSVNSAMACCIYNTNNVCIELFVNCSHLEKILSCININKKVSFI